MTSERPNSPDAPTPAAAEPDQTASLDPVGAVDAVREGITTEQPGLDPDVEALRHADFPLAFRGYDAAAVDAYVAAVGRLIDRFEESNSPTTAVRRALDRVGEQTAAILRQAEQAAHEMTISSRAKADDRLQRCEREAKQLHAEAQARVRRLDDDNERLWQERQRLIEATKDLADKLRATADDAESRFPPADEQPTTQMRVEQLRHEASESGTGEVVPVDGRLGEGR